jgi:transcriptional antiterminator RfaH
MHWYLVHSKPRQERLAFDNLTRQGYACYLPVLPTEKIRQGAITLADEPLFPRYLFIRLGSDLSAKGWGPIRYTTGVSRLVSFGAEPAKIDDDLVMQLQKSESLHKTKPARLFEVGDRVSLEPWGRFLTDGRGHYQGAVLGDMLRDQPGDIKRLLAEEGARLDAAATHVGQAMAALGFRGPAGIDALVYRTPEGRPALKPLVELNPRMTMGRVARALGKRVRRDRVGLWVQVSRDAVRAAGFAGFSAWADDLRARAPLAFVGDPPQIAAGALFTTDPARAERLVTVLIVGESLAAGRATLGVV